MLRRSISRLSMHRSVQRIPTQITTQIPSYLSSRKAFSVAPQQKAPGGSGSDGKPSVSGSPLPQIFFGSVALGAAFMAAYQTGYLDKYLKEQQNIPESAKVAIDNEEVKESSESKSDRQEDEQLQNAMAEPSFQDSNIAAPSIEQTEKHIGTPPDLAQPKASSENLDEDRHQIDTPLSARDDSSQVQDKDLTSSSGSTITTDFESFSSVKPTEQHVDIKSPEWKPDVVPDKVSEVTPDGQQSYPVANETEANPELLKQKTTEDVPKEVMAHEKKQPSSIADEYYLDKDEENTATSFKKAKLKEITGTLEDVNEGYISKDGKLVLDFLQAIHAAEKRQAELDARIFAEEKRIMKEKYEKELKDARVRELMYAEREALLEKELNKERVRAAAAVKSLQENLEGKHRKELEEKEAEAELKLKKVQDLAKAELEAAIASEKASQIEKMAEANLNINALCMAFYARSEEARQSHSVHKLALGAIALEDALSKGLPIQKEMEALHTYLEGIDKDSLVELVLTSLPEETRKYGTDTLLQLNQKFHALKGTLRHFSLIPPGGGGILTHSLARVASLLKVQENDQSGDGIEAVISRVECLLAQGKLCEAANALEEGVQGSQAAEVVDDWVRRARNRAITEQALTLLQSYATSVSLT